MNPQLLELALRKQRLQIRSAAQRQALIRHARVFAPLGHGVDRVVDTFHWARAHAPLLSGVAAVLLVLRPRAMLRWARRGWLGWQLLRRARNLIP